ncbi:MAG: AsmA-like C-terminal region-containing protein [Bacteroidota bacterium]
MENPPRFRKKIWIVAALILLLIAASGFAVSVLYGDTLRQKVVDALNAKLKARTDVKEIDFTVFSSFPYAIVRFKDVRIAEPEEVKSNGTLLEAGKIGFRFHIWDLVTGQIHLNGVEVSDAYLNIQVDSRGNVNYDILKDDTSTTSGLQIELKSIVLRKLDFSYNNIQSSQSYRFKIAGAELSGDLTKSEFSANVEGFIDSSYVKIDQVTYLDHKPAEVAAIINVNTSNGTYNVGSSTIKLSGMVFAFNGSVYSKTDIADIDLALSSKDADIASLLSLLPSNLTAGLSKFNCSGDITFNASFKGRMGNGNKPVFVAEFNARNASANPEGTSYKITSLNGSGSFTSRKSNAAPYESLVLKSISAKLEGAPFNLDLRIENFSNPRLDLNLKLDADLAVLGEFYKPDTVEALSGKVSADINFNGIANEKSTYKSNGTLSFNDATINIKDSPIDFNSLNGSLHLRGNDMVLERLQGTVGESDFSFTGSFNNLVGYFLLEDQRIDVDAKLQSVNVDLDQLLSGNTADDDSFKLEITDKHRFALEVDIAKLNFRKFNSANINGSLIVQESKVSSSGLSFKACGGDIQLSGTIDGSSSEVIAVSCVSIIRNVDITSLFQQMGNFGQEILTDKNLKGRISANVDFQSKWDKSLNLDDRSVIAQSDISIENGELIRFKPMLALSKYLKGSDLETIRFSNLTNTIEIRDRKIIIPVMDIRSSALDLTASGTHTFDNMVDYKLGLYLSQILGRKVKQMNTEFGTIEDDGLGRPRIYLSMKGPASDPKFTWDRKGTEQKISDEIRKERNTIRDLLKKEFGNSKNTENTDNKGNQTNQPKELELETED